MKCLDQFNLSGRTALVTGASRGIGRAIAIGLGECGADVAVHYAGNRAAAEDTAAAVRASGVQAVTVAGDLSDTTAPQRIVDDALAALGRIDILVSNASIQFRHPWHALPLAEAQQQIQVNLIAAMQLIQLTAPAMQQRKWGRIVTVGSVQQDVPHKEMLIYAATKSAQLNMVRNLARELAPDGVTVNNLAPGVIATDRNAEALDDPARRERVRSMIPVGFIGKSEDCVAAALLLCSDAGRYITGVDLLVDGGWCLR